MYGKEIFFRDRMTKCNLNDVSYEVPGTGGSGYGPIRRALVHETSPPLGLPTHDGTGRFALTSYENFIHATETFADKPCLGVRPINPDGSARGYRWSTYREVRGEVERFSSGLVSLGLCPRSTGDFELREQPVLGIMMRNRPEWFVAEQACFLQAYIPVPFYDTAKSDTLGLILSKISSLKTMVCSSLTIDELIKTKRECSKVNLSVLISVDAVSDETRRSASSVGLSVLLWSGVSGSPIAHSPPSPADIYTFCFTSGTTGEPKGALITHRNIIVNGSSLAQRLKPFSVASEVCLSFLPLPHMFERVSQLLTVCAGGRVGFFQGDVLKLVDDLIALRPTRFVAVPRVLTRIRERVQSQLTGAVASVFNFAVNRKMTIPNDPVSILSDPILFKKVSVKLGLDRVKQILTGSAPISADTLGWFRAVFPGVSVNEGYGQTECTLVCSLQGPTELSLGDCGAPLACNDVRLADVPEMGYRSTDKVHTNGEVCVGRGEICIRGENVFAGYYKMAESPITDGWLLTGDIGMWTPTGQLRIIDRKKNIFKLSQGEYVAPEKIESVFSTSQFVLQSFVYGDSFQNHLVAIIVPNPETVSEWAARHGQTVATALTNPKLKATILADLIAKSKAAKLHGFEIVKNIHIEPQMWTADNLLTPTFKLKRKNAEIKYKQEIADMYTQVAKL